MSNTKSKFEFTVGVANIIAAVVAVIGITYTIHAYNNAEDSPIKSQHKDESKLTAQDVIIGKAPVSNKQKPAVVTPRLSESITSEENWSKQYIISAAKVNSHQSSEYTIIITNGPKTIDFDVTGKIGQIYREKGVKVNSSVLNSKFVIDGLLEAFFSGDIDRDAINAISKHVDYLVLGKTDVQYLNSANYSNIEGMQSLITTEMTLTLRMLNLKTGQVVNDISLSSTGIGANKTQSNKKATDRILEYLSQENLTI